jgi:hypothetical protein
LSINQASGKHCPTPESAGSHIGGPLSIAPTVVGGIKEELLGSAISIEKPLNPYAHESEASSLQAERVVEAHHGGVELATHVSGLRQGATSGDGGEVSKQHLDTHCASDHTGITQSARNLF